MLDFLYYAVSWVLLRWHGLMNVIGLPPDGGLNWALSIVLLVVTARLLLFRLFIKQVHYQRKMQELQPRLSAIKEKYKNDKAAQQREMMALQQAEGFNPLSGCLPLVAQLPVFIGLLHVLRHLAAASNSGYPQAQKALYGFTATETDQAAAAKFLGAPLSAQFQNTHGIIERLGGDVSTARLVITVLLVVSAGATFLTQRQVMARATTTPEGSAALIQKAMLYVIPLGVLASGFIFNFPVGVLLYWFTSNIWTMAQQFYINKFHPAVPGAATAGAGAAVGEVGRTLAPRPGAKPTVGRRPAAGGGPVPLTKPAPPSAPAGGSNGATGSNGAVPAAGTGATGAGSGRSNRSAGGKPTPGARPAGASAPGARPGGGAPPGTRKPQAGRKPGQAKKRR